VNYATIPATKKVLSGNQNFTQGYTTYLSSVWYAILNAKILRQFSDTHIFWSKTLDDKSRNTFMPLNFLDDDTQ